MTGGLTGLVRRLGGPTDDPVARHGPMVYGVCRRLLGNGPDADDAFQAVWLVFLRRGADLDPAGRVGPWLYGVAVRTARHARSRRRRFAPLPDLPDPRPTRDPDLAGVIDAELTALPAGMRAAVLLCEVEGRSLRDAAGELGLPLGTVASRLARGRQRLADRLRRRGVTLSAAALSGWLAAEAVAAVPAGLVTLPASPAAVTLSRGVLTMFVFDKLRRAAVGLTAAAGLAVGGAGLVRATADPPPTSPAPTAPWTIPPAPPKPPTAKADPVPGTLDALFADLTGADADKAIAAAFTMADDPARTVPYLAARLKPVRIDDTQIDAWLADLGAGTPEAMKAAAARRFADATAAAEGGTEDGLWAGRRAWIGLEAVLAVPRVQTRIREAEMAAPPGPVRKQLVQLLIGAAPGQSNINLSDLITPDVEVRTDPAATAVVMTTASNGSPAVVTLPGRLTPEMQLFRFRHVTRPLLVLERINVPAAVTVIKGLAAGEPEAFATRLAKQSLERLDKK